MRLLILGGTAFLGREIADQAVSRGWEVTAAARGKTGSAPAGARFVTIDRDADDGLAPVAGEWDAIVDVARQPGQVRRAVRDLRGHFVFVSTGNVYADTATPGLDEEAPLLPAFVGEEYDDPEAYGPAKVACEQAIATTESFLIARAGLIGGPGDTSGRSSYWPWRFARNAPDRPVLVPEGMRPAQLIDVRDLAGWLLTCAAEGTAGIFNATGRRGTLDEVLAAAAGDHRGPWVRRSDAWLTEHGVNEWMGPRSLPFWLTDPEWTGFGDRDSSRAFAAGLHPRPLDETFRDALAWQLTQGAPASGLTDEEEDELLAQPA